jgi:S1-C subfamily serine protease
MGVLGWVALAVALVAAIGGYRSGLIGGVLSWAGLAAGLYLAARYLPQVVALLSLTSAGARLAVTIGLLLIAAVVGEAVGGLVGSRLHSVLPTGPLRSTDRFLGAAAGIAAVACALWLLLPSVASVPGWPATAVRRSALARWMSTSLPAPPHAVDDLRQMVVADRLPQMLGPLAAGGTVRRPPASSPLPAALLGSVERSTVRVEGQACDRILDGSGFAVGPDLVLTNAHVVAGEPAGSTSVLEPDGRELPARVVRYDSERDLALLWVPGLGERPLALAYAPVGSDGDQLGHPGGTVPITVSPYRIAQRIEAVGKGLYGRHRTLRQVFVLSASLAPGDSGGPLVDRQGQVVGVAFAISVGHPHTAFALTAAEIRPDLADVSHQQVPTGACLG